MTELARYAIYGVTLVFFLSCGNAQVSELDALVSALMRDYDGDDRPGACVLARHRGAVMYERCFGLAEVETGRPNTRETNFRLASLTKQFTATAVLRLEQDGLLSVSTPLRHVFPEFHPYADAVTIYHLLTHTSGLIAYESVLPAGDAQIKDAGVLELLKAQDSTYFVPGSDFRYSNSAYAVLAQVVERVSGERFGDYLARIIFQPVGMSNTAAHEEGVTTVRNRAYGYSRGDAGGWQRTDQSRTSAVLGDGGIYSSVRDLNRWLEVVEGSSSVLLFPYAERMLREARLESGETTGYAYGWYADEYRGHRRYRHDGTTMGFRNEIRFFPDDTLSVLLLSNRNEIAPALKDALTDVFLDYGLAGR